jgi:hypothetical protein
MLATAEAKAEAAGPWLAKAAPAIAALDGLYARVGVAFDAFNVTHKRPPTPEETEAMVTGLLSPEVRALVESSADPANDPFGEFRRDAAEPEAEPEGLDD